MHCDSICKKWKENNKGLLQRTEGLKWHMRKGWGRDSGRKGGPPTAMSKEEKGSVWCNLRPAKVGNAITWTSRKDCLWSPTAHPPLWAVPAWPAPPFCKRNPSPPPTDYFENNPRPQALLCLRPGVGVGASSSSQEGLWAATPPSICMQAQSQGEKCFGGATLHPHLYAPGCIMHAYGFLRFLQAAKVLKGEDRKSQARGLFCIPT